MNEKKATPENEAAFQESHLEFKPSDVRISAIVDAHFRLIVDGELASPVRRWGSAQELV